MIELILALALDMSLPEFQPQEDLSGNYIVGTYDVSNDEVVVEEIPVEAFDGLSVEAQQDQVILGNVLRSGNVVTIESSVLTNMRIRDGALQSHSGDNLNYIFLSAGVEYTLYNLSSIQISSSLSRGATVTQLDLSDTYTPSEDCYILRNNNSFYVTYISSGDNPEDPSGNDPEDPSGNDPGDPSGNDPSGNDPSDDNISTDLTNIEDKLDNIITLQRSILLVLLVSFLFPIIISCVKLLKGGKDV